jgi:K+-transporting ATPase KdpF subunit
VTAFEVVALCVTLALLGYLLVAMLWPERFT